MSLLLKAVPDDSAEVPYSVNVSASIWGHWKRCIYVWENRHVGVDVTKLFQIFCWCGTFLQHPSRGSPSYPVLGDELQYKMGLGWQKGVLFIKFLPFTQCTSVNLAAWEKSVRFHQYSHSYVFLWTSSVGLLMVTEHMLQLLHLELCDKCVASSIKMQIESSMCSGSTLEEISSLLMPVSRNRYYCHMMELAGPHHHFWSHDEQGIMQGTQRMEFDKSSSSVFSSWKIAPGICQRREMLLLRDDHTT